ncbi:glucosaminidase domain-containing protein [Kiloniella antarctica]|uniref:Glucosaminidase domain-containing protein n=1 Tax=Kiloniella antarctica TaxID=1550907 RepID=A0ABW5BF93_9PROT
MISRQSGKGNTIGLCAQISVWALMIVLPIYLAYQLIPQDNHSLGRDLIRQPAGQLITAKSRTALKALFDRQDYLLSEVRRQKKSVPRLFLKKLPNDLNEEKNIGLKKSLFIRAVLPLILRVNERIVADRARVLAISKNLNEGKPVKKDEIVWLTMLSEKYGFSYNDPKKLLVRLDVIPVSLALAQSIQESGWGTSRFARQGNALFGQRTWSSESVGMLPEAIEEDAGFKVKSFSKLYDSIQAYAHNLNTNNSYQYFRARRATLRGNQNLNGYALTGALLAYSEEAEDYISAIQVVIKSNRLQDFDGVRLSDDRADQRS